MSDERGARREARGARPARRSLGEGGFDAAIDRAAREMLDVEPPAGLRGRVLDRIELHGSAVSAFRRKDRGPRTFWLTAAPIAAAAVIVLGVMAPWRDAAPAVEIPPPPVVARANPPVAPPLSTAPRMPETPRTVTIPLPYANPPADPVAPPAVAAAASVAAEEDVNFTAIAALAGPQAIAIDRLADPLPPSMRSIEPAPLEIRALEVTALPETPRERREE